MNVLISGGCKNGKSYRAQCMAKEQADQQQRPLYYIATMIPRDHEDRDRVKRHLSEREGWGFTTLEQGINLKEILKNSEVDHRGIFLLDSVTALLSNVMFDETGHMDPSASHRVKDDLLYFAAATGNTFFVSDYIYGDIGSYGETTEAYRKGLADADRALAEVCDRVIEVSCGIEEVWK